MVLSNKKLKQKLRLELSRRAHQPYTTSSPELSSPSLPIPRLGASKREKRRQREQLIKHSRTSLLSEGKTSAHIQQSAVAQNKELPNDAPGFGSVVSPDLDSGEANCVADGTETERYRHCLQKVLDKFGQDKILSGTEEKEDGSIVVFEAEGLSDSKKSKTKKNKRTLDSEDAQHELKRSETNKLSKKKKKDKIFNAESKQDPQEPVHMSDGKSQDTEETKIKSERELIPTEKAGRKSFSMKSPTKHDQTQQADNLQEKLAQHQSSEMAENQGVTDSKKVYVGGIPYYSSEEDIRAFFEECGSISEMDFKTFPDSGKFRGIALISFKTEAAAQRALALDGADMGGRFLKIQPCVLNSQGTMQKRVYDEPPRKTEGYTTAYVGNLSWDITEDDLRGFFKDCKVDSIRFALDKSTGAFKGYGHIDFADDQSLELALELDQHALLGRPIKVAYAVHRRNGGNEEKNRKPFQSEKG